jgi:hypothetical protein
MLPLAAVAILAAAQQSDWVPMRWPSTDPKSLTLLDDHPVNCLLIDEGKLSPEFAKEAKAKGLIILTLKGNVANREGKPVAAFEERHKIRWNDPIAATRQGLWPGIRNIEEETGGKTHAAASGAPWIDTNAGFLRFARTLAPPETSIWIANEPPARSIYKVERYLQAIGDAAMTGARWVVGLDADFAARLTDREPRALRDWKRIGDVLRLYESHKEWRGAKAYSKLALLQGPESGALVSGGVLDMIAVKHTPVTPITSASLPGKLKGATMAVNIDPASLTAAQNEELKAFTRAGGTLLTGPPGWKFPPLKPGQITLGPEDVEKLDLIWKEMNSMIGRRNLGARLFNVSSMLSNLQITADGKQTLLHLVNYADYPVEDVTVHLLGTFKSAKLYRPETPGGKAMDLYPIDEGVGFDIDKVGSVATIVLEP